MASLAGVGLAGGLALSLCVAIATTGFAGLAEATTVDDAVLDYVDDVLGSSASRRVFRHIDAYWPTLLLAMVMVIAAPGGLARRQAIHVDGQDRFWAWWTIAFVLWGVQGAIDLIALHRQVLMGWGWGSVEFLRMVQVHWHILIVIAAASALMATYYRVRQGRWPSDLRQLLRIKIVVLLSSLDWIGVGFLYLD